jgi:c-di-AMP phosphodiesterase-like protein
MAHIVADDVDPQVQEVIAGFRKDPEYEKELFIDRERAIELTGPDTALVIVDTNRSGYTACEELLALTNTVVVLDHHRQGDDRIREAVLSYIEPYASSACEMIAEILQYISDDIRIKSIEADSMYAGIMIDTNNFMAKAGVRTFEAAAFLRYQGVDPVDVKRLFQSGFEETVQRYRVIEQAKLYRKDIAIACAQENVSRPLAGQAADEILSIDGIHAAFVLFRQNDAVFISARSDSVDRPACILHLPDRLCCLTFAVAEALDLEPLDVLGPAVFVLIVVT